MNNIWCRLLRDVNTKKMVMRWKLPECVSKNYYANTLAGINLMYRIRVFYFHTYYPDRIGAVINEAKSHFEDGDPWNTGRKGYYKLTW